MLTTRGYMAVRQGDHEWLDTSSYSCLLEECRRKARALDKRIPHYSNANPVVRFVQVEIIEV